MTASYRSSDEVHTPGVTRLTARARPRHYCGYMFSKTAESTTRLHELRRFQVYRLERPRQRSLLTRLRRTLRTSALAKALAAA